MNGKHSKLGFTLIELLVVLAIIALLVTLVSPNYFLSLDKAKEQVLKQNLETTREAIDKFRTDKRRYPASLEELVINHYLKKLPEDPITGKSDAWNIKAPPEGGAGVYDLASSSTAIARDGTPFSQW